MMNRDEAIKTIRAELKRRSGKTWSVTGGRGTAWGWIRITAPPARRVGKYEGVMTEDDQTELAGLLNVPVGFARGGVMVAASQAHYTEYVERAKGIKPTMIAEAYWD